MIAIVDYGVGNLRSVQKAFEAVGSDVCVTDNPAKIAGAQKIVLPGVGAMGPAMDKLKALQLIPILKNAVLNNKPFLGICVGFQLLFEQSDEGGRVDGLGFLKGNVKRFTSLKVPHMGWNQIQINQKNAVLFKGIEDLSNVYFCHSYFVAPADGTINSTLTDYGITFTSSIQKGPLFGVQFHPEKSQQIGLAILKNFEELKI